MPRFLSFAPALGWFLSCVLLQPVLAQEGATDTYRRDAVLFAKKLFRLDADETGGIIARIPSGGRITLSCYYYDTHEPDNEGPLLYRVYSTTTSTQYAGTPFTIPHSALGVLKDYIYGDWITNDMPSSLLGLDQYLAHDRGEYSYPVADLPYPVVLELEVSTGADVRSVKIPGFDPLDLAFFKAGDPFTKVLAAFKNPLDYPDYYIVAAHRGYWKDYPENSLPAYDLTVASGTDMVELDTRVTKDDTLVAFHDECLDRITTGSGKLRDKTWAEVSKLNLRDRFGHPTAFHMVTIRQALEYLKGRAIVNLDFKEQIIQQKGKPAIDRLTPAFKKGLLIAKETGTLPQLVIKGKFSVDDLQDILEDVGISLNDFTYTPVAFGWDTRNMGQFVTDWLATPIHGIELTYKVAYDPILRYIPRAINRNIRTGVYTFWPEDCNGVIAEDNVNDPNNFCRFNYRQYDFLNQDDLGTLPDYSNVGSGSGPVDPVEPDDRDYGGGSYDYAGFKQRLRGRPDRMNDGRGDWDWLLKQGADFVITDRPVLMVEYLKGRGKRKLEIPVMQEVTLPDCPVVEDGIGGRKTFTTLRGMVRRVADYHSLEFFSPDTRQVNIDTNLVIDEYKQYSNGKTRKWVKDYMRDNHGNCSCANLFSDPDSSAVAAIRRFPLHTLPEWSTIYPGYDLYINSNWFDVRQPWPIDNPRLRPPLPKAMYKEPCTNVFGYWQSSPPKGQPTGTLLTRNSAPGLAYDDCDGLVMTRDSNIVLVKAADLSSYFSGGQANYKAIFTMGGYIIARNGAPIPYDQLPRGTNKNVQKKRSLIGLNGNEIIFAEFQSPMMEPYQAAYLMVTYLHCKDVFMFDAGGSTTMLSTRGNFPVIGAPAGPWLTSGSAPEDRNLDLKKGYRPIPNFMAVRIKTKAVAAGAASAETSKN